MKYCAVICVSQEDSRIKLNGFEISRLLSDTAKGGGAVKVFAVSENEKANLVGFAAGFDGAYIVCDSRALPSVKTYAALEKAAKENSADVFIPVYDGKRGQPILAVTAEATEKVISGEKFCENMVIKLVPVEDPGAVPFEKDAEGEALREKYAKRRFGMSPELFEELYEQAALMSHIRAHCRAVGELSAEIAEELIKHGYRLDVELCRTAGAMHDILRLEEAHPVKGARFMRDRGYWAASHIIAVHNDFEGIDDPDFDESTIVCLADKLLQDDNRVSFEVRYKKVRDVFPEGTPLGDRIREDERKCRIMGEKYKKITGISLE